MSQELVPSPFGTDRAANTANLLTIPGLVDQVSTRLGNAIFIPPCADDVGKELMDMVVDIDGAPVLFIKPKQAAVRATLQVYPGEAFDHVGTSFLFRHHEGGIPLVYKQMVLSLAVYRKDPQMLEICYTPQERADLLHVLQSADAALLLESEPCSSTSLV